HAGGRYRIIAMRGQRSSRDRENSEGQVGAAELEAVQAADDAGSDVLRLKEFAGKLLDLGERDAFEHGDQLGRGKMAIEIDVVAGEAAHALATALEREQGCTLQVILGAAKLFFFEGLVAESAEFGEDRAQQFLSVFERRAGIDGEDAGIAIRIDVAEDGVGEALSLADILEEARGHSAAEHVVEYGGGEATVVGHRKRGNAQADVDLLEFALAALGEMRR